MLARLVVAFVLVATLSACTTRPGTSSDRSTGAGPSSDWSPAPAEQHGLSVLASADANGFRLRTGGGRRTFLPGVNLGSTTPLHQPGEVASISRAHFRRWIDEIGDLGFRVVRIYTLLPPSFYEELRDYNRAHRSTPVYLVQGVYLPDETYLDPGKTLYDDSVDSAFAHELVDLSAAVHGDFDRPPTRGRASGHYTADVSPWLVAWIVGVELDGEATQRTDRTKADAPAHRGRYFASTGSATATERWLASHMDSLAAAEAKRGTSAPIAFVNWPTTDPLKHPDEPLDREDLVGVDANHVLPTSAWPGGTFASFHAYPYYPDFQRYEPGLDRVSWRGEPDRYAGYLTELKRHFADHMPLLVTEFGVPSSLGSAHRGTRGRDQGGHSEADAMAIDADTMRLIAHLGLGGAFVFSWTDEWFKRTWNTMEHQDDERRQLWHDPLTNEQWFGMIATDPKPLPDAVVEKTYAQGAITYLHLWADASWVHVEVAFRKDAPADFDISADVVPGADKADYRLRVRDDSASLDVRRDLDPIRLDTKDDPYRPDAGKAWHPYALITNRAYREPGRAHPAEFQDVGRLVRGQWDPRAKDQNSLATWNRTSDGMAFRIPWSMLGFADPSSRTALGEGNPAKLKTVPGITFTFATGKAQVRQAFRWDTWNFTTYAERRKTGIDDLTKAARDLAP
jgi:hypothetical protein